MNLSKIFTDKVISVFDSLITRVCKIKCVVEKQKPSKKNLLYD